MYLITLHWVWLAWGDREGRLKEEGRVISINCNLVINLQQNEVSLSTSAV